MSMAAASVTTIVPQGRGGRPMAMEAGGTTPLFDNGSSPSFSDLIDILNPLQHIPVVNTIYRAVTGDHESAMADVIGGTLYGGPIGLGAAMADLGLRNATGKDAGEHVMAWLGFDSGKGAAPANATAVAAAQTPSATVADAKTALAASTAPGATAAATPASATNGAAVRLTPASLTVSSNASAPMTPVANQNGPTTMGDYLVFGSGAPATPGASASAAPKTFTAIGAGTQPATSLPPVASAGAANGMPPTQLAAATSQIKMYPVPPRNGPALPKQVLHPPTTGPGALPGGQSMAVNAQEMAVQQDPQHNFLSAYTQALDKYRNAQKLGDSQAGPAAPAAPAIPPMPPLMQPAAAVIPAEPSDEDESENEITVH